MRSLTIPRKQDPRWLLIAFFGVLLYIVLSEPGFARRWEQLALSIVVCTGLDFALTFFLRRKLSLPVSGFISSLGTFILVDSPYLWATVAAAALAMLSKHFIRVRDQHIFNPNNFGVVVCCLAFPDYLLSGAFRWGGRLDLSILLFAVGTLLVLRARRIFVSLSYAGSFLFFNVARALTLGLPPWAFSLSILGPGMQLFLFYMISDPRTSPNDYRRQIIFGVCLGLVDNFFRHLEWRDSPLLACFVVCAVYNLYRTRRPDQRAFDTWRTRELALARQGSVNIGR